METHHLSKEIKDYIWHNEILMPWKLMSLETESESETKSEVVSELLLFKAGMAGLLLSYPSNSDVDLPKLPTGIRSKTLITNRV